jgi:hypothetical protein
VPQRTTGSVRAPSHRPRTPLARSMHAQVTAPNNTKPLWPSNTRHKDDRVWAAARTGSVLVTALHGQCGSIAQWRPRAQRTSLAFDDLDGRGSRAVHPHTRTFAWACAMPLGACIMDWPGRLASSDGWKIRRGQDHAVGESNRTREISSEHEHRQQMS